jgi:hypothetical protein
MSGVSEVAKVVHSKPASEIVTGPNIEKIEWQSH